MFPRVMAASQAIYRRAGGHKDEVGDEVGGRGCKGAGAGMKYLDDRKRKDFTHDRASRPGVRKLQTISVESILVKNK